MRLTEAALEKMLNYDWPGNVRELIHTVTRSTLRASKDNGGDDWILEDLRL